MLPRNLFSSRTRFPRVGLELPAVVVVLVFIVLGSLTPFELDYQFSHSHSLSVPHPSAALKDGAPAPIAADKPLFWPKTNLADAGVNIAVYVFFGASLFALMRGRFGVFSASALTLLCGVSLSLSLEMTQLMLKGRYASLWDVLFNSIGTALGAAMMAVFYRKIVRWLWSLRRLFLKDPMAATEAVVVFGLLAMSAAPFDFVTSAQGLEDSMRESQIPVAAAVAMGRPVLGYRGSDGSWSDFVAGDFGWAAAFALLGYLFVLRSRRDGVRGYSAFAAAIGAGWLLAIVLEVVQLFAGGQVFALADIIVYGLGASIGATLAVLNHFQTSGASEEDGHRLISNGFLACVVLGQAIVLLLPSLLASFGAGNDSGFRSVDWVPFAGLLAMPFPQAGAELIEIWCTYALLIVPLFVWVMRLAPKLAVIVTIGFAVVVSVIAGLPHAGDGSVGFSTNVLAAFVASYWMVRLAQFFYENEHPLVRTIPCIRSL